MLYGLPGKNQGRPAQESGLLAPLEVTSVLLEAWRQREQMSGALGSAIMPHQRAAALC